MIIISTFGQGTRIPVEIMDCGIEEARHIAEEMMKHISGIDLLAQGIILTVFEKGFVKEQWSLFFGDESWAKYSKIETENRWKEIRNKKWQLISA